MKEEKQEWYPKLETTWLGTYWKCIQQGFIYLDGEKQPFIVGDEMRTEIEKLIADLDDPRYIYDTTESDRRIAFKEKFCLQGKSPFYNVPIKLMLHQKAFWEILYSFRMSDTGKRRFTKALLLVARKNGKSTDIASDGCYDLFLGNGGVDICCTSFDEKTASLVWREIAGMRSRLDTKNEITKHNLVEIRNNKKNITIFRMSSKTTSKDGRNIDKNYYDEIHMDKDSEIHDAVYQSMSVKDEPLMIMLTTEGTVNDGFLDHELEYARAVLRGEQDDIHYLPYLFTQDSETEVFQDKMSWCKSNPSLIYGVKKWAFIENQMLKAQIQKSTRVTMLCKDFNIKQSSANAWLNYSDVMYEQEEVPLSEFRGCYCIAGVDLSQTLDLSCVSLMFMKKGSDKKYIFNKYFIPETKLDTDIVAGAKYREWQQKGYVDVHKGSEVNLKKVAEYFKWLADTYQIFCYKIGYDNRFAHDWLSVMDGYGYKTGKNQACENILQNRYVLSTPMKLVEADLVGRTLQGLTEMDRWCLMNVAMDMDNKELIMPIKIKTEGRIDGAAAMITCNAMHFRCANDYRTMVENR